MALQRGILDSPQKHILLMTFDLSDAVAAAQRLEVLWTDISERLHDWHAADNLTITIGFGLPLYEKTGRSAVAPAGLRLMPGWEGDGFSPSDAQADLLVQVCADERSTVHHAEQAVRRHLAPAFTLREHHRGFGLPGSRGMLGFVDGTGNPHGDARLPAAQVPSGPHAGGTFMVMRKLREQVGEWERLSTEEQERAIGRRKTDSASFDPPDSDPATSHRRKSSLDGPHGAIELLRRSFPYAERDESGLLFVCFVADLDQFEAVKGQMTSVRNADGTAPGKDAIESFFTAISGGYYFVPPVPGGDGYPGDGLFA